MALFTIRVWAEKLEDGKVEWRGKVQHVTEEEGYYFRDWPALVEILLTLVSEQLLSEKSTRVKEE